MQDIEFRQLIEGLKLRSPIEVIVGERLGDLRKTGAGYTAKCPFHDERTPSFTVDPTRGLWRCWGACAEGGDVIRFIERFDGVSFQDALRLLARQLGEELPESLFRSQIPGRRSAPGEASRDEACYDILQRARKLYRRQLMGPEGAAAREYARSRGLSDEVLETFQVGWANREGNPLLDAARAKGISEELLEETGLVKRTDGGRVYDFFRGRWMVPIADRLGRTVGFGGRVLPGDEKTPDGRHQAKYVNTRETPFFHKGRLIYGLDLASESVRRTRHLVLVEGYTDVIAAHQAGFAQVAAVLGTSTTQDHAALIRRCGVERVTLVFDGDQAGRNASIKALGGLLSLGLRLEVAELPAGSDPCDLLVGDGGQERFSALLDGAKEWFEWTVDGLAKLEQEGDRLALGKGVDEAFSMIASLEQPVERSLRIRDLARGLGLPEDDVRLQWRSFESRKRPNRNQAAGPQEHEARGREDRSDSVESSDPEVLPAFENLLGALLVDNSLIPVYSELAARCPEGEVSELFQVLMSLYDDAQDDEPIHAGRMLTALGDHPARMRIVQIEERARTASSAQGLARDQELWLEQRRHELEVQQMRKSLAQSHQSFDGGDATKDLLKSLHEELKSRRVPAIPGSSHPN